MCSPRTLGWFLLFAGALRPAHAAPVDLATAVEWRKTWGNAAQRWVSSTAPRSGAKPVKVREGVPVPSVFVNEGGNRIADNAFQWEWLQFLFHPFWHSTDTAPNHWVYFRRTFEFSEAFSGCASYISTGGAYDFYVNDIKVAGGAGGDPREARQIFIERHLRPGRNVLALAVRAAGNPLYLFFHNDGHECWPVRAGRPMPWLCTTKEEKNWEQPEFAPRGWVKPMLIPFSPHFSVASPPDTLPIWHPGRPEGQAAVYFRLPFVIDGFPISGNVEIVADNAWELYVNGKPAALEKRHINPTRTRSVNVLPLLRPGKNVLAVKAYNYGGPAALACVPKVKVAF